MAEASAELVRRGHEVHSALPSTAGCGQLAAMFEESGMILHEAPSVAALTKLLNGVQADAVIALGIKASMRCRLARLPWPTGALHLIARNGLDFKRTAAAHALDRWTSRLVDIYLCNSTAVADHLVRRRYPRKKVRVLTGAVSQEWCSPQTHLTRSGPTMFMMVGNSRPEKNILEGMRVLANTDGEYLCRLYTDNATEIQRDPIVTELVQMGRLVVVEGVTLTPEEYDRHDVLLHPAVSESLPRAVMEATARGCYVIAFDTGDTKLVVDQTSSSILKLMDYKGLEAAIVSAIDNTLSIRRFRKAGRLPTVEEYIDGLLTLIREQ